MKKQIMPFIALALMATSCSNNTAKEQTAGIRMENMDTTAIAGNDFYQYATGGWAKLNPISDEYSRFGSFDKLAENNREQLKVLIEGIASQDNSSDSIAKKIGDMYNVVMDSVRLNTEGAEPVKVDLNAIDAITSADDIATLMGRTSYVDWFFATYVNADVMNSKENLLYTHQSGIGMGQRDYYLETSDMMNNIRTQYREYIMKMFSLAGLEAEASNAVDVVMEIETRIAKAHYDQIKLRDPQVNYNLYNVADLSKEFAGFNWTIYFSEMGANISKLCISQPEPVKECINIMQTLPLEKIKLYMKWRTIESASSYLSDTFVSENFNFHGRVISGKKEQAPRWKNAVDAVNGSLGEAVGQEYVKKYFPAEAKTRMETLVQSLLKAYGERIDKLDWMSNETKAKAHEKLSTFYVKVGYPNKWKDYSSLEISREDSYWTNIKRIVKFNTEDMIADLSRPVDKDKWFMNPQTVNAYYNPTTNEICFPAGILQYPFFDMEADDAFNYGAIGVVIAHEITHGFDDMGSQFDKDGNLKDWWTEEDKAKFRERTLVMEEYFNKIEVAEGLFANGAFTLGENIADHGGVQVAYHALKSQLINNPLPVKDGLTAEQRFFIAYANVWAGNIRHEEIVKRTKTDPHSLGKWRVNGALPHINAWYEAFGITEDNTLYLAPENRVSIW